MPDMYGRFIYNDIDNFKEKYNKKTEYKYLKGTFKDLTHIHISLPMFINPHKIEYLPFNDLVFVPGVEYDFIVFKEEEKRPEIDLICSGALCYRITDGFIKMPELTIKSEFKDSNNNDVDIFEILEIKKEEETNNGKE